MGYFKDAREKKRVTLPSDPKYWVEIYTDFQWGQSKQALTVNENGNIDMIISADKLLNMIIVDWNLTDEKGEKVPVNPENIDRLQPGDALHLSKFVNAERVDQQESKKN